MKINCFFCGKSFSRDQFKDPLIHPCESEIKEIVEKFQGDHMLISEEKEQEIISEALADTTPGSMDLKEL